MLDWISRRQRETADSLHKHTDGASICAHRTYRLCQMHSSKSIKIDFDLILESGLFRPVLYLHLAVSLFSQPIGCGGASTSCGLLIVLPASCLHPLLLLEGCRVQWDCVSVWLKVYTVLVCIDFDTLCVLQCSGCALLLCCLELRWLWLDPSVHLNHAPVPERKRAGLMYICWPYMCIFGTLSKCTLGFCDVLNIVEDISDWRCRDDNLNFKD